MQARNGTFSETERVVNDALSLAHTGRALSTWSAPHPCPRIVVLGGGTGSHTVLSGLSRLELDLTSVVSVMDSGGSSGRLRDEYGFLPPGDARQCLVALASNDQTAAMLRMLFTYRFRGWRPDRAPGATRSLDGHNLGNLFIAALTDVTGSVEAAYAWAGRILGARGRVIPVTTSSVDLCARLTDGHVLTGEAAIDVRREHPDAEIDYVYLDHPAYPSSSAVEALRTADLIIIGPGDLYTSVIPNLLVDGIVDAIAEARYRVYVVNLMTKPGETDGFRASTFVERLLEYLGPAALDAAVVNTAEPTPKVRQRYAAEGAHPVEADVEAVEALGVGAIAQPVASSRYFMRHDPAALVQALTGWLGVQLAHANGRPARTCAGVSDSIVIARHTGAEAAAKPSRGLTNSSHARVVQQADAPVRPAQA